MLVLFQALGKRLQAIPITEIGVGHTSILLNSFSALKVKDQQVFDHIAKAMLNTSPENFDMYQVTLAFNAFARC